MVPGVKGMLLVTIALVCNADDPQALFAPTEMFPLLALAVALMVVVVELPVQPEGNVQVYDVAFATALML